MSLRHLLLPGLIALGVAAPALAEAPVYSDADLLALASAHSESDYARLPLGDQHYTLNQPQKAYIDLCRVPREEGGGAQASGPWIHGSEWNPQEKIAVSGDQVWSNAAFSMTEQQGQRVFAGNGLPISHGTGFFPVQANDPAFRYDRNPNRVTPQNEGDKVSLSPVYTDPPYCMGMEVGIMLTGVPLLNGFDAELRDAAAHEIQDQCNGHPQQHGRYHYHSLSACIKNTGIHQVIGYALDGFPITGGQVAPGKWLMTKDLDVCHGLISAVTLDGESKITYHYVMTPDFPYSASCFRAKPAHTGPPAGDMEGNGMGRIDDGQNQFQPQPRQGHGPPQEALSACQGGIQGSPCNFISPRGDRIAGQCLTVPEGVMACVPQR